MAEAWMVVSINVLYHGVIGVNTIGMEN